MSTTGPGGSNQQLDTHDWQLLHLLADDGGVTLEDLAQLAGLSESDTAARVAALRDSGVIAGIHARVNPQKLGLPVTAFFMVRVAQTSEAYEAIDGMIRDIDQVEEAHAVSGQFDWIVKVRAADPDDLRDLLTHKLSLLPGFVRAETMVVLSTACEAVNVEALLHPRHR
ncbi:MAG: Lrp/AsnC family transcriptional regulator [Candidatus Dormibacteraceae bacterium]